MGIGWANDGIETLQFVAADVNYPVIDHVVVNMIHRCIQM